MKNMKTCTKFCVFVGVFLVLFIIANEIIFCVHGSTPDTLVQCVLGTSGLVEVFSGIIAIVEKAKEIFISRKK